MVIGGLLAILVQEREWLISDQFRRSPHQIRKGGTIFAFRSSRPPHVPVCTPGVSRTHDDEQIGNAASRGGQLSAVQVWVCPETMGAGWSWVGGADFSTPEFRSRAKTKLAPASSLSLDQHGSREQTALVYHSDSLLPPYQPVVPASVLPEPLRFIARRVHAVPTSRNAAFAMSLVDLLVVPSSSSWMWCRPSSLDKQIVQYN